MNADIEADLEAPGIENDCRKSDAPPNQATTLWTLLVAPHSPAGFGGTWSPNHLPYRPL